MKNFKYLLIIVAAVMLFASCSDDDPIDEPKAQTFLEKYDDVMWGHEANNNEDANKTYLKFNNIQNDFRIEYLNERNVDCHEAKGSVRGVEMDENSEDVLSFTWGNPESDDS